MKLLGMLLACVAVGSCSEQYTAKVQVLSSNPRECAVSVTTTTYPAAVRDAASITPDSKPGTEVSSESAAGFSIPHDKTSLKVDGVLPPRLPSVQTPLVLRSPLHQFLNNTNHQNIRDTNDISIENKQILNDQTPQYDGLIQRNRSYQKMFSNTRSLTPELSKINYTETSEIEISSIRTNYTPIERNKIKLPDKGNTIDIEDKNMRVLTNQTATLQNTSINVLMISENKENQTAKDKKLPINLTDFERSQSNSLPPEIRQSAIIRRPSLNSTTHQNTTDLKSVFQHARTNATGSLSPHIIPPSSDPQQAAEEDPTNVIQNIEQDQIEQTGVIDQSTQQYLPNEAENRQPLNNQTTSRSNLSHITQQAPPNRLQITQQTPTSPTQPISPLSTQTIQQPPSSTIHGAQQVPTSQTNTRQPASAMPSQSPQQPPLDQTQHQPTIVNGTDITPIILVTPKHTPETFRFNAPRKIKGDSEVRSNKRRNRRSLTWKKQISDKTGTKAMEACPCASRLVKKMACRKTCTRNTELTWILFFHALVFLVIYVILLSYLYRKFWHRKKNINAWRREALGID